MGRRLESQHDGRKKSEQSKRQGVLDAQHGGEPQHDGRKKSELSKRPGVLDAQHGGEPQQPTASSAGKKKTLLPAGLVPSKIEEMDPLHEELSDFINRQQIAYLTAITERIMDKEFGDFLKENFEEKMSNYAKSSEHEPRGVGYTDRTSSLTTSKQRWKQRAGT